MIAKRLLLALLAPLAMQAQLKLVTLTGTIETTAGATYDYGDVAAGDTKDVRFRARNTGNGPLVITTLSANGAGFSIVNTQSLPITIAPTNFVDITVRLTAAAVAGYSANLQVNGTSVLLFGRGVPLPDLSVASPCTLNDATREVNFGPIQQSSSNTCAFTLTNRYAQSISVSPFTLSGDGFQAVSGVQNPFPLAAGQSATFTLRFSAALSIPYSGALTIGSRVFTLSGTGFPPPLSQPIFTFDTANIGSAQQRTLTVRLSTPAPVTATGLLRLTFTPATTVIADDTSVLFLSTGTRTLPYAVNQGSTQIQLNSQPSALFQTGTTAGILRFALESTGVGISGDPTITVTIAPLPIVILGAGATRRLNDLDITVSAYDNTYTAGPLAFTFYDTTGNRIGTGAIPADFTGAFATFFRDKPAGSSFLMRVTFPVTGDAKLIGAVDVDLTNSAGTSRPQRLSFPATVP